MTGCCRSSAACRPSSTPKSGAYILPPIRYPDGRHYLKIGIGSTADPELRSLPDLIRWFKSAGSADNRRAFQAFLTRLIPALDRCRHWHTDTCAVSFTATGLPYIDWVLDDRIAVAVVCNGKGAKSSDDWGWLAARLMAGLNGTTQCPESSSGCLWSCDRQIHHRTAAVDAPRSLTCEPGNVGFSRDSGSYLRDLVGSSCPALTGRQCTSTAETRCKRSMTSRGRFSPMPFFLLAPALSGVPDFCRDTVCSAAYGQHWLQRAEAVIPPLGESLPNTETSAG